MRKIIDEIKYKTIENKVEKLKKIICVLSFKVLNKKNITENKNK